MGHRVFTTPGPGVLDSKKGPRESETEISLKFGNPIPVFIHVNQFRGKHLEKNMFKKRKKKRDRSNIRASASSSSTDSTNGGAEVSSSIVRKNKKQKANPMIQSVSERAQSNSSHYYSVRNELPDMFRFT